MADGFEILESDRAISRSAMKFTAERFHINTEDENVKAFLEHLIEVNAASRCRERNLRNIIHEYTFNV